MNNIRETSVITKELFLNGFTKVGSIDSKSAEIISNECSMITTGSEPIQRNKSTGKYAEPLNTSQMRQLSSPVFGKNADLDRELRYLLENNIINIVDHVAGKNAKLSTAHIRCAHHKSKENSLHVDGKYTVAFSVLLRDTDENCPSTCFVKGSHLFPADIGKGPFGRINLNWLKPFLVPVNGKKGDIFIFVHRSWHGMIMPSEFRKKPDEQASIILFSFHAEGDVNFTAAKMPELTDYGENFKDSIGEIIYKKFDGNVNLNHENDIERSTSEEHVIDKLQKRKDYRPRAITYSMVAIATKKLLTFLSTIKKHITKRTPLANQI